MLKKMLLGSSLYLLLLAGSSHPASAEHHTIVFYRVRGTTNRKEVEEYNQFVALQEKYRAFKSVTFSVDDLAKLPQEYRDNPPVVQVDDGPITSVRTQDFWYNMISEVGLPGNVPPVLPPEVGRNCYITLKLTRTEAQRGCRKHIDQPTERILPVLPGERTITKRGWGWSGRNGGPSGDLIVTLQVDALPPIGDNFRRTLVVSADKARTGGFAEVRDFRGRTRQVTVSAGAKTGDRLPPVPGGGRPGSKRSGNLIVALVVKSPDPDPSKPTHRKPIPPVVDPGPSGSTVAINKQTGFDVELFSVVGSSLLLGGLLIRKYRV